MKKVTFGGKRPSAPGNNPDDWVHNREAQSKEHEPMKRLTIDVPLSLHRRIKTQCANAELVMADVIRDLLEKRFPPSPVAPTRPSTREIAS
jgi:hypothetical protein